MTTDAELVHAALAARGWGAVAPSLGLRYVSPRHRQPCPMHGGKGDSLTLDERDGRLTYICATHCGAGDVLAMIQKLRGCGFREALREAADIGGVVLTDDESDEAKAQRTREREAYAALARKRQPEPEVEAAYPPAPEVEALWSAAVRVDSDPEVAAYLAGRAIPPADVAARDLLRAIPPGARLPRWARYRGDQAASRTWLESGHRLLVRVWDAAGEWRSVRAWRISDDPTPKRLPPAGHLARGLVLASATAVEMLRGHWGPCRIVVVEGEPDAVTWSVRTSDPVLGVLSGSWTPELAARIPFGSEVVVRTHVDTAGEKYARQVIDSLRGRATLRRLTDDERSEAA
jgi:hypothetical protein